MSSAESQFESGLLVESRLLVFCLVDKFDGLLDPELAYPCAQQLDAPHSSKIEPI